MPQEFSDFIEYYNNKKPDIYIFGADIAGKVTQHILKINNIFIQAFLDNNKNKFLRHNCVTPDNFTFINHKRMK